MDYQLLSRAESHAQDLFKLGQELEDEDDIEDGPPTFNKRKLKKGPLLKGTLTSEKKLGPKSPVSAFQTPSDLKKAIGYGSPAADEFGVGRLPQKSKSVPFSLDTLAEDEEELGAADRAGPSPSHAKSSPIISGRKSPAKSAKRPALDDLFQNWISVRRLPIEEQEKIHYEDLFGAFTRNFGKGFALGFGGKALLNLFTELVSTMRSRKIHLELFAKTLDGAKDHGLFFALLLATHNSIMYMSRETKHAHARYRGAVAGLISGLVSLTYLPMAMRRAVILFTFVRAFELACGMAVKRKALPKMEHADTALMSASSAVMIYTWLFHPKCLDPSYVHFLSRQVQVPTAIVRAMASVQAGLPIENLDVVNAARQSMAPKGRNIPNLLEPLGYDAKSMSSADKAGLILHPGQSFTEFASKYFVNAIRNAVPVYVPVYTIPLLLFSRKRLMKDPVNTLKTTAMGASRSTLFLAVYCTFGIGFMSLGRRLGLRYDVVGKAAMIVPFLCGAVAGIATLIEKRQRRIELALYVTSKAVEGVHNVMKEKLGERIAAPMFGDAFLFAASFAVICHANLRHPELVRESYRALLMRFFDTDVRHKTF